jgi:hypothetical protein
LSGALAFRCDRLLVFHRGGQRGSAGRHT